MELPVDIKAVIFDFDGTIADTMPFLTALAVALISQRYAITDDEAMKRYLETTGLPFASQLDLIFPGHPDNQEVAAEFESAKLERIFMHPIFPEVIPALECFRNNTIMTFICSSTKQEIIRQYIRTHHIDDLLDGAFGYRPDCRKSDQIDFILGQFRLVPDEVLFVGDSLRDYHFAREKKIHFIGLTGIFGKQDFMKMGAACMNSLDELADMLGSRCLPGMDQ